MTRLLEGVGGGMAGGSVTAWGGPEMKGVGLGFPIGYLVDLKG